VDEGEGVAVSGVRAGRVNLVELLGEAWCVTVCREDPAEALRAFGVAGGAGRSMTFDEVVERADQQQAEGEGLVVAVLARLLPGGCTLVVQYEGTGPAGWIGVQPGVLELISRNGPAASLFCGAGHEVHCARDGRLVFWVDLNMHRVNGAEPGQFAQLLIRNGFRSSDWIPEGAQAFSEVAEPAGLPEMGRGELEYTPLVLEDFVGCRLTTDDFDDPWLSGFIR
jgi:hypothetical protein